MKISHAKATEIDATAAEVYKTYQEFKCQKHKRLKNSEYFTCEPAILHLEALNLQQQI